MLINCVAYQDGRKLADIPVYDIDQWLRKPDCFVWVALRDATDEELRQMQQEFDLHELAVEDARHGHQRLYDLKRRASVLRHVVAPLLEVAGKLHGGRVPAVCARSQEYFRDVHDHLARINDAIVSAAGILFWRFRRAGWL